MKWKARNILNEHCFFDCHGGVSKGVFAGMNVSPKGCDSKEELWENLNIAAGYFGLSKDRLALLNQGVSAKVFYVDKPTSFELTGDGMVTDRADIILALRTADCAPILLEDAKNGIVAVAHAGWRGALGGVIENTVDLMLRKGAILHNIAAAVGPCIGRESYEVDEFFHQQFLQKNAKFDKYFYNKEAEKFLFDLEKFCVDRLNACGVDKVEAARLDTYKLSDDYYSFRRFTHQRIVKENGGFATQLSAIVLRR